VTAGVPDLLLAACGFLSVVARLSPSLYEALVNVAVVFTEIAGPISFPTILVQASKWSAHFKF